MKLAYSIIAVIASIGVFSTNWTTKNALVSADQSADNTACYTETEVELDQLLLKANTDFIADEHILLAESSFSVGN